MADRVFITDVSPRDGLQNEPGAIPTADKLRLIRLLAASGVDGIELTSFVSPRWVPQLADAADVVEGVWDSQPFPSAELIALVPNERGMHAVESLLANRGLGGRGQHRGGGSLDTIALFTAASETFCRKNINCSIAESIERFKPLIERAAEHSLRVRAYISCAIACPFEGPIAPERVAQVARMLGDAGLELGADLSQGDAIDLGDTIGAGTPESVTAAHEAVTRAIGAPVIWHLHDTFGRAAECVRELLRLGCRSFDGSAAGLGGCPYASTPGKRAPGNIATDVLVRTVHAAGYRTGVDLARLAEASAFASEMVARARAGASS
ncbi:MAG: hydroxymethylglutaryl-CoA lyase [Planctomycetota bacterium]|nr:hydroxymethylglutaryl-CoA lyase [Planctomycetota bacterium]